MKDNNLAGLTVVITGASSGFGKGIARQLGLEGVNLVLAARRTALIEELAGELGDNAIAVTADVGIKEDVERIARTATERFGQVDVWINNAGIGAIGPFTEIPLEDHARLVQTNLMGVINGSHYALRHFKERGSGILINMASIAGRIAFAYYPSYSATKFAVLGLTGAIRKEVELEGYEDIHVCAVSPWATDTPWFDHAGNYSGHTTRMQPLDDPQNVVDAVIGLIRHPKDDIEVGTLTKGSALSSHLMPGLTESFNAKYIAKQIEEAPPADYTSGSLHEPMVSGTGVLGGLKQRIEAEDRAMGRT